MSLRDFHDFRDFGIFRIYWISVVSLNFRFFWISGISCSAGSAGSIPMVRVRDAVQPGSVRSGSVLAFPVRFAVFLTIQLEASGNDQKSGFTGHALLHVILY